MPSLLKAAVLAPISALMLLAAPATALADDDDHYYPRGEYYEEWRDWRGDTFDRRRDFRQDRRAANRDWLRDRYDRRRDRRQEFRGDARDFYEEYGPFPRAGYWRDRYPYAHRPYIGRPRLRRAQRHDWVPPRYRQWTPPPHNYGWVPPGHR